MRLRLFLNLLCFSVVVAMPSSWSRQAQGVKSTQPAAPKDLLQFTSGGHVLGFASGSVYVASGSHALRVEFVRARATSPVSDAVPANAQRATPLSQVTYPNLWEGVTLTYDAPTGAITRSVYRLGPYSNAENICLRYNAAVSVQSDGSLRIGFRTGTLNESAPQAWQERAGKRVPVQVAFAPRGKDEITFALGAYDRSEPLFIDPTLTWNTFLGGDGLDQGKAVTVDGSGNVYVAGYGSATWGSPVRAFSGGLNDAFVAKLDSSGNLIWNTFLGGDGDDRGKAVAVDGSGNVYVTGSSTAFWFTAIRGFNGGREAFVAKLDSSGNLIWNTFLFLGLPAEHQGNAVAVDGSGSVYVAGDTFGLHQDAFAAKLDSSGNLIWNTFLGGDGANQGFAVAVDGSGNVYVAGYSTASWGSPVRDFSGGEADGFAAKLDPDGNLTWNTFLGGNEGDFGQALAVDGSGNVYVAGESDATWGGSPVQDYNGGAADAFAAKLDPDGNLILNTFLGGNEGDFGGAMAVDGSGNVYVAGTSDATWGSPDHAFSGGRDAFAATLDPDGNLIWNTFLGGDGVDIGNALAVDGNGSVYLAGYSDVTWGSPVRDFSGGGDDAFVAKLPGPIPAERQLVNISSRANVGTGDNVAIDGFIIHSDAMASQPATKRVIVRGIGPSLQSKGVTNFLAEPILELHDGGGTLIAINDDWRDTQESEIEATGLAPTNDHESAMVVMLASDSSYTAILRGKNDTTGIGLVEVYDLESTSDTHLANISGRAFVSTGDDVLIGGVIVRGNAPEQVLVRAIGPSLAAKGVTDALQDPTLDLYDAQGTLLESNDNWMDSPEKAGIIASGLAPSDNRESAILFTPEPGNFTAIVRGKNNTIGVGLVEAYRLGPPPD